MPKRKREIQNLQPYNPLAKRELGASVAKSLLEQAISPLPPPAPFKGAGIYAIYYCGDFNAYDFISAQNADGRWEIPIYVGRAVPKGARKGVVGLDSNPGTALYLRLCKHAETLRAAQFPLDHFRCRYLAVDDIWIPLGETLLIQMFNPLWNTIIDGFGNNDPGSGRYAGMRPPWHELHPGVPWAEKCRPSGLPIAELLQRIEDFKLGRPVPMLTPEEAVTSEAAEETSEE